MTKIKQFLKDVKHEINMLKEHATDEEKQRLDFESFDPYHQKRCVYGQITGSCSSTRARDLMDVACVRVMNCDGASELRKPLIDIEDKINGSYNGQAWVNGSLTRFKYLSALEGYILTTGAKNKLILDYIKDNTGTIKLKL